jgi:hypothetical protein
MLSPWISDPTAFLRRLCAGRGLYLLGAGASAGEAPFGSVLLRGPLVDFLRHARSFSETLPEQPPLSRLLLGAGAHLSSFDIDGRALRPGTEDLTLELLHRMPPNFPRSHLMHKLAAASFRRRKSHDYLPFRLASPSLFINYNHDGLAGDLIGDLHPVIAVHGSIDRWIGAPASLDFILSAGIEYGLAIATDELLMLEPESYADLDLARRLLPMARCRPDFIAIIGYSFGWTGRRHNDAVSLDFLVDHYRKFVGEVFVVDPYPERLQEILAERLRAARILALPARWNLLAHAFLEARAGRLNGRTLNDYCSELCDAGLHEEAQAALSGAEMRSPTLQGNRAPRAQRSSPALTG